MNSSSAASHNQPLTGNDGESFHDAQSPDQFALEDFPPREADTSKANSPRRTLVFDQRIIRASSPVREAQLPLVLTPRTTAPLASSPLSEAKAPPCAATSDTAELLVKQMREEIERHRQCQNEWEKQKDTSKMPFLVRLRPRGNGPTSTGT